MTTTAEQYRRILDEQPVLAAPMCGISDHAYRQVCRRFGGPHAFTQMAAAFGVSRGDPKTIGILDLAPGEGSTLMQLFGCDPDLLAASAARMADMGAAVVDLNMGCPARKVTGSNGGSALLRQPELVARIFKQMRAAVPSTPLTVKMRWDWDQARGAAVDIARIAESEGLDGVCLHARTREQGYSGQADWDRIAELKAAVSIPVIGNGDVRAPHDAEDMVRRTGCDGVMIGRAAIGGPWLLRAALARVLALRGAAAAGRAPVGGPRAAGMDAMDGMDGTDGMDPENAAGGNDPTHAAWNAAVATVDPYSAEPAWDDRVDVMLHHAGLMLDRKGPRQGLIQFRKHAAAYLRGARGGKRLRVALMKVEDYPQLEALLRGHDPNQIDPDDLSPDAPDAGLEP